MIKKLDNHMFLPLCVQRRPDAGRIQFEAAILTPSDIVLDDAHADHYRSFHLVHKEDNTYACVLYADQDGLCSAFDRRECCTYGFSTNH